MSACACGCGGIITSKRKNLSGTLTGHHTRMARAYESTDPAVILATHRRKRYERYMTVYAPLHPRGLKSKYVAEHVLIAEKALGRPLERTHPVHHHDGDGFNNANTNLVICEDLKYHELLHVRQRILSLGGDPDIEKPCWNCKRMLNKSNFHKSLVDWDGLNTTCNECHTVLQRHRRARARGVAINVNQDRRD